jgi:hypothetical protein
MQKLGLTQALDDIRVLHIAGTKGKGSTAAMTASILKERGFSVGLFTSPHLCDIRERFRISGCAALERCNLLLCDTREAVSVSAPQHPHPDLAYTPLTVGSEPPATSAGMARCSFSVGCMSTSWWPIVWATAKSEEHWKLHAK